MSLRAKNPGVLDRVVQLRFPVRLTNSIGESVEGFANGDKVRASWSPVSGKEYFSAEGKQSEQEGLMTIRYRDGIGADWRVFWRERIYELSGPPIDIGRRSYLDLPLRLLPIQDDSTLFPTAQSFTVDLAQDDEAKTVSFPVPFSTVPTVVQVQLVIPVDGFNFVASVLVGWDEVSFEVSLGAVVPSSGYKLAVFAVL